MQKTILLHVFTLLTLVVTAISGLEAALRLYYSPEKWASVSGWIMAAVFIGGILLYFRLRKLRKTALIAQQPSSTAKSKNKK